MSEEDDEAEDLRGALVMDRTGTPCGHALRLLRDRRTGALVFVSIRDGLLGRRRHLIPLAEAEIGYERIDVPYSRARVMDSPSFEPGHRVLPEDETAVCAHYGLAGPTPWWEGGTVVGGGNSPLTAADESPGGAGRRRIARG